MRRRKLSRYPSQIIIPRHIDCPVLRNRVAGQFRFHPRHHVKDLVHRQRVIEDTHLVDHAVPEFRRRIDLTPNVNKAQDQIPILRFRADLHTVRIQTSHRPIIRQRQMMPLPRLPIPGHVHVVTVVAPADGTLTVHPNETRRPRPRRPVSRQPTVPAGNRVRQTPTAQRTRRRTVRQSRRVPEIDKITVPIELQRALEHAGHPRRVPLQCPVIAVTGRVGDVRPRPLVQPPVGHQLRTRLPRRQNHHQQSNQNG